MAARVSEIMNKELFCVRPEETIGATLHGILGLGITGAPVVDEYRRPRGMASLRDLIGKPETDPVDSVMNAPAAVVGQDATISEAGHRIAQSGYHRLVVVDEGGRAIGVVSALDVVRALLGRPIVHPAPFPHLDQDLDIVWTDPAPLEAASIERLASAPGVVVLLFGGAFVPERIVWTEHCDDVRGRLHEMVARPQSGRLGEWLEKRPLLYRTALVDDVRRRRAIVRELCRRADPPMMPPRLRRGGQARAPRVSRA